MTAGGVSDEVQLLAVETLSANEDVLAAFYGISNFK